MAEQLAVKIRKERGTTQVKKLRRVGMVPAILYGHGQENVKLAISADAVTTALRKGSRFVNLTGEITDSALIRELQWDTYGLHLLHVDLARVSLDERIHLKVPVELKGQAQGVKDGGVLQHIIHDVEIECTATSIPEKVILNVTNLKLGGHLCAKDITLAEGVKLLVPDGDEFIVVCARPVDMSDDVLAGSGEGAEPELIRKAKEEGTETAE